eukprot:CAMPEP_0185028320 /NCGR_PEP_ID=MMETSP1103-20130426/13959_1 /TAXON_ID=36769 /ORGANISM="Paraphysomonas bandaiensis, Strain Caron Lab Isolate" /LENGTH=501 /DNA_ID=CAMNT_0027562699 /DNA_START=14 /DNA_END=1519 /DNA_ORIENTATION=+
MKLSLLLVLSILPISLSSSISHIVVLMMENRSFDHLLGWMRAALHMNTHTHTDADRGTGSDVDGLHYNMTVPRDPNDPSKGEVPVTRNGYDVSPDDPKHSFDSIATQINDNNMDGFVLSSIQYDLNETNPVSMFDPISAPIINTLAKEYAVFDKWFCSVPTSTDPNRAFAMSGTSRGVITNFNGTLWDQQSYFDYLRKHGRSFAGYYQDDLWALGYFEDMLTPENSKFVYELEPNFYDHVAEGVLADFVWLQPRMNAYDGKLPTWQHPDASVREGERLIKEVYEALRAGPKWNETLLLITYDEHGGFYDHVPPPNEGIPSPDGIPASNGFEFDQLGVRVPTLAISPLISAGTVVSSSLPGEQPTSTSAFDSTSILSTANILFGLDDAEPLSDRMAWANTFAGLVSGDKAPRTDCPETLPEVPPPVPGAYKEQRQRPINDHLEAQILYYCVMNYPGLHSEGKCPGTTSHFRNQGDASDWIMKESRKFREKLRGAEKSDVGSK